MKNPWVKKNPFMSMWLSGANSVAGSIRGQASAQVKRQSNAMMKQGAKEVTEFWAGSLPPPRSGKKKSR